MFARDQIQNYEWRLKRTRATCNAPENKEEVYRKLNLQPEPLGEIDRIRNFLVDRFSNIVGGDRSERQCSLLMKYVDIWHDIVARNESLALILEDDAVFVPYFREKFDRTISTAIWTDALKIAGLTQCVTPTNKPICQPIATNGSIKIH
jgi:hypothetical protein